MSQKLTDKDELIGSPLADDWVHIVDVSDTSSSPEGTSKKVPFGHLTGSGWAQYSDSQYTEATPFTVAQGVTNSLPNNAADVIENFLPSLAGSLYDGVKITPENIGDGYAFVVRFCAKSSSNSGVFDFGIDIGGTVGQIFNETITFAKGSNTEQAFSIDSIGYSLDTFVANGGIIKVESLSGITSIYNISLQIHRTHKALEVS